MSGEVIPSAFTINVGGALDLQLDELATVLQGVTATVGGALDVGLGDVRAALAVAPVQATLDAGLNDIRVKELAPVQVEAAVTSLPEIRTTSQVELGLDDIRIRELPPVKLELACKPIRVHLPVHYSVCIELFGIRLLRFSLCGEGMLIGEDYQARASERC